MCIVFVCGSRWTRAVSSVLLVSAIILALPGLLPAPSVCSVTECDFHINAVLEDLRGETYLKMGKEYEKIRRKIKNNSIEKLIIFYFFYFFIRKV